MCPQIDRAGRAVRPILSALLDAYLDELSGHREFPVGATDSAGYRHLDAYWSQPGRHPLLIRAQGHVVGFALIRGPESAGYGTYQVAEFYIDPAYRRRGIGRAAVLAIWRSFPGPWELQFHCRNSVAERFWSSCVGAVTADAPSVREVQALDGRRLQYNFVVAVEG